MIKYENEVCEYLGIPSIPKKKWDGIKSFRYGVGIVTNSLGEECYVICTYDGTAGESPKVKKSFALEPFMSLGDIYVVPSYMDTDVDSMDLDDSSKEKARALVEEASELENEGVALKVQIPDNEYFFDHITNDEEAIAYITAYNKTNGIRGSIPSSHESIVMRLSSIWSEHQCNTTTKKRGRLKGKK